MGPRDWVAPPPVHVVTNAWLWAGVPSLKPLWRHRCALGGGQRDTTWPKLLALEDKEPKGIKVLRQLLGSTGLSLNIEETSDQRACCLNRPGYTSSQPSWLSSLCPALPLHLSEPMGPAVVCAQNQSSQRNRWCVCVAHVCVRHTHVVWCVCGTLVWWRSNHSLFPLCLQGIH